MRDPAVRERVQRVEELLRALDDDSRALAAVQALVELYGECLRRIAELDGISEEAAADELVSHVLLVHDLHPVDVQTRVARALEKIRPYLGSHGGSVELLEVSGGVARLRLHGTCDGCASSAVRLKHSIKTAIMHAAPELERVEADGLDDAEGLADHVIVAPSQYIPRIHEAQASAYHLLCELVTAGAPSRAELAPG